MPPRTVEVCPNFCSRGATDVAPEIGSGQQYRPPVSTDGGCVDEIALALEEGRNMAKELPGEAIDPGERVFEVSRLLPDVRGPQYNFVHLLRRIVRDMWLNWDIHSNLAVEGRSIRTTADVIVSMQSGRQRLNGLYLNASIIASNFLSIASKS